MNPASAECKRIIVLDTSAFLGGFDPFSLNEEQVTVRGVEEELRTNSMARLRFKTAAENGKITIKKPSQEFINRVKAYASKIGDSYLLSETDIELLALSLELKSKISTPQILTDDYSIQNVSTKMGIEFLALANLGIRRLLEWIRYCPACHKKYPVDNPFSKCQVCGTALKRKPKKNKTPVNKTNSRII